MTLARCIPQLDLGGAEASLYPWQFVQTPKLIVILVESRHVFRLIPLNAKHPDDLDPSYLGDSVGRWEGDTLVVDVTGFKEIMGGLNIHTDALHIVERFTRADYNTIDYKATVEDPTGADQALHHHQQNHVAAGHAFTGIRLRRKQSGPGALRATAESGLVTRK